MVAVGFAFDDLDLVVDALQLTGVDGKGTMVQDAFPVTFQRVGVKGQQGAGGSGYVFHWRSVNPSFVYFSRKALRNCHWS